MGCLYWKRPANSSCFGLDDEFVLGVSGSGQAVLDSVIVAGDGFHDCILGVNRPCITVQISYKLHSRKLSFLSKSLLERDKLLSAWYLLESWRHCREGPAQRAKATNQTTTISLEESVKTKSLFVSTIVLLSGFAGNAIACAATVLPEPSTLSVLGIAAVAGILVWRIKRNK